jgi:hypothetical protein
MKFEFRFVCSNNGPGGGGRIQIRSARGAYQLLILLHNLSASNQRAAYRFPVRPLECAIGGGCRRARPLKVKSKKALYAHDAFYCTINEYFLYTKSESVDVSLYVV